MSDGITLDYYRFEAAAGKLSAIVDDDLSDFMEVQAKGIMVELFKVTPPASGAKASASTAMKRGQETINRDLAGLFKPVQIKGTRTINHLFGDFNPSGVGRQPPYVVPTRETVPNPEAIYLARVNKRSRIASLSGFISRGRRQAYYVAEEKLEALRKKLHARVGWLASGWNKAANALKAAIPAYARKHNAPGDVKIEVTGWRIRITFENNVSYGPQIAGIERRMQFAIDKQAGKMERQIPHVLKAAAEKSGFKAAA